MREISELIYETCKTYLFTQGKFLLLLWVFIAIVIVLYFGILSPVPGKSIAVTLPIILLFSLIGMGGSYSVAWFGIRVNTFANSRTAFAGLRGKPYPINHIPLRIRHERWHDADQRRAPYDANHFAVHSRAITPDRASSVSPSANRWERPRCVSPAASSPRSPTSAPT